MSAELARVILTFRSVHDALKADKALRLIGLAPDLIPVPREIASDCGFCLVLDSEGLDLDAVREGGSGPFTTMEHEALWAVRETKERGKAATRREYERIKENH